MARTNYSFEKRQRELAKKKKQEEKRQRKAQRSDERPPADGTDAAEQTPPASDAGTEPST